MVETREIVDKSRKVYFYEGGVTTSKICFKS